MCKIRGPERENILMGGWPGPPAHLFPPAAGSKKRRVGQPRRETREESFMPVEITGAWVRAEKGIGGRIVLGVVCAGAPRFSG
jgi:hypothetical protein